ncbi:stress-inducible protein [Streptomyces spiroverticillatus]|uniref:Stress-inducible protein n=1 Tax=Streptomyces finlayi TaxID=67296 RepID=A0A918WW07_9ACTN|nr:universal stress protein [Streptomyces finlayi]GHA05181.1 stress-inducible protein [Streptomyces spiroverticillatus]GHC89111.1 stress-inducible protein [Streptomyces finlayi]
MSHQRTITAGVDGSPESLDAADWAAREALLRELPLHLVHAAVTPVPPGLPAVPEGGVGEPGTVLDRATLHLSYAHPALGIVEEEVAGHPAEALLATAETSELLVLGSRGNGALTGLMVGSVAQAVAARAACPVALVRAGERPADERQGAQDAPYLPVLLGIDLDRPCDELLEYAFDAAATRRTALHVVHAWTLPLVPTASAKDPGVERTRRLDAVITSWRHKFPGTEVVQQVVHGRAGHHLLLESAGASLLVVGRPLAAGPHLGPTVHSVIHHVLCPVVVVPHA